jgi:hypothetical protein
MQTPPEKAPGPDGYIEAFYKSYWNTVKEDVVGVIHDILSLRANCWNLLNSTNIALIVKKMEHITLETIGQLVSCTT